MIPKMPIGLDTLQRRGLDESLEAYAKRTGRTPDEARMIWRIESLRLLHVHPGTGDPFEVMALVECSACRIAPGVAVPTNAITWSDP